jgi:hypothetical protein
MATITLDATTRPPTVHPRHAARPVGDSAVDGWVVRYWFKCLGCNARLEVEVDRLTSHDCAAAAPAVRP